MRHTWTIVLAVACLPWGLAAQTTAAADSVAPDSAQPARKTGGLLGKVKGVANNKVVRQVAKTALCNAVPGGQVIAGAIDAANSKSAGGAAGAAAGAATGSNCMPGMSGMGMAPGAASAMNPAGGMGMGGNADAMAAMQAQMDPSQIAAMQAQMAQLQAGQMPSGQMPAGMAPGMMTMPGGEAGMPGEAGGTSVELSSDVAGDLKHGRTIVRNIDWMPGTGVVSSAGSAGFTRAISQVGAAMQQAGGSYRLDLYMDPQSANAVVKALGPQRLATVRKAFLQAGMAADPGAAPQIGKAKKDKDPRLEIVKTK